MRSPYSNRGRAGREGQPAMVVLPPSRDIGPPSDLIMQAIPRFGPASGKCVSHQFARCTDASQAAIQILLPYFPKVPFGCENEDNP